MIRSLSLSIASLCLAAPILGAGPENDRLTFSGRSSPGTSTVTFANNAYSFTFDGDEHLVYVVDLSDPLVATGNLRVKEVTSDSYPVDGGGVIYRDPKGDADPNNDLYWWPFNTKNKTTLVGHSKSGNTVTIDYSLAFNGDHPFRYEFSIEGKVMRVRITDPTGNLAVSNNFDGVTFGQSSGVENPVPIRIQGHIAPILTLFRANSAHFFTTSILDMFQSNAVDYGIPNTLALESGPDWIKGHYNTVLHYKPLSNNTLAAPLDDSFVFVVTRYVKDALVTSTAPPSPYRSLMMNRMVFDAPETVWSYYSAMYDQFLNLGMYNLAGYFFLGWTTSADDAPLDYNAGPDWYPAVNDAAFTAMLKKGSSHGHILGAYSAFNSLPPTAPASVTDPADIVRDANGNAKTLFGIGFPLLHVQAAAKHSQKEALALKQRGGSAVYLDIQTYGSISKGPDGDHIDQQASTPWSKTMRQAYVAQKSWMDGMRGILAGPMMGEGSISNQNTNMEFLYYGYVDSVQRCVNTGSNQPVSNQLPAGSLDAPTNWPIIPEYEWRVAAQMQTNHGNGFYDRFFGPSDGSSVVNLSTGLAKVPLTQDARDLYNAFVLTYGHTGFIITNGVQSTDAGYMTFPAQADTYFMTNALQTAYYASPVLTIRYWHGGKWKTFEQVLFATETTDTFRHIPVAMVFKNNLVMYVNHGSSPLAITDQGVSYTLPPKTGWYASAPGLVQCFSAIPPTTGGVRIDYCNAPGRYEYFNGRGVISGYGSLTTPHKRIKYHVLAANLTVTEDGSGLLQSSFGTPPTVTSLQILPGSQTSTAGQRFGLKAVAFLSNGGVHDVTTLLDWYSTKPAVVGVNESGVATAQTPGFAKIVAYGVGNQAASINVSVTP